MQHVGARGAACCSKSARETSLWKCSQNELPRVMCVCAESAREERRWAAEGIGGDRRKSEGVFGGRVVGQVRSVRVSRQGRVEEERCVCRACVCVGPPPHTHTHTHAHPHTPRRAGHRPAAFTPVMQCASREQKRPPRQRVHGARGVCVWKREEYVERGGQRERGRGSKQIERHQVHMRYRSPPRPGSAS